MEPQSHDQPAKGKRLSFGVDVWVKTAKHSFRRFGIFRREEGDGRFRQRVQMRTRGISEISSISVIGSERQERQERN
ncbi:hypothetical protein SLA2020_434670 [Shorea laevis]